MSKKRTHLQDSLVGEIVALCNHKCSRCHNSSNIMDLVEQEDQAVHLKVLREIKALSSRLDQILCFSRIKVTLQQEM